MPTASEVAERLRGELVRGDPSLNIHKVARPGEGAVGDVVVSFGRATAGDASLLVAATDPGDGAVVIVADPKAAFAELLAWLHPRAASESGVHPSAVVEGELAEGVSVGALAVIEGGARVGQGTRIGARVVLEAGVEVGAGCRIEAGAILLAGTRLGDGVRIGAGSVVGSCGFGFLDPDEVGFREAVPQVGGVQIGDRADVGALVAIDRGTLGDTLIGPGARLDNLVQVGHNSCVGAHAVLAGQVGLSGSVEIGDGAVLAGQSGVADHRRIGTGAVLLARAAAFRNVPDGATYGGTPARPRARWMAQQATLSRLSRRREESEDER